ncbi:MAG: hypothetical protein LBC64_08025 [Fibromonadaceae bacterium]|jgi:hypothetical protein|nr:hypothetical protein [Fibromonadaceae bacterium]
MDSLFGSTYDTKEKRFCNKWTLEEAIGKCLDVRFQESKQFNKLIAELYAHAFTNGNETLFKFMESRFSTNVIQDKEVHIHFELVSSREQANAN